MKIVLVNTTFILSAGILYGQEGLKKEYYPNGKIKRVLYLKNGKPDGQIKSFFENGAIKGITTFKNGVAEGENKSFVFSTNGQSDGDAETYYQSGKLKI